MTEPRAGSAHWTERVVEAGTLFLLVFTPLAFGTVEPWSTAVAELAVLVMVLVWVIGMVSQWELRLELPPGWLPASLFLALVLGQLVPLPTVVLSVLAPALSELRRTADVSGGSADFVALSLFPHETRAMAFELLAVAGLFVLIYNTCRTPARASRAVWTMIITASAIALLGMAQRMAWNGRLYWIGPETLASSFGPFVNRTHFAGLVITVVPIALALVLAGRERTGRRHERLTLAERIRRWNSTETGPSRLIPFLVLLMGGAALVAGSRGGMVALVAALLSMVGLASRGRSGSRRRARVAIATALVVLAGVWIGGDILFSQIERLTDELGRPAESPRIRIWTDAIALWGKSPAVGTGLGTFGIGFPMVRTFEAPVAFTHGESDWVQLFTDTGLLGLGLALAAAAGLGRALLRSLQHGRTPRSRTFALAGFVALLGAVVQGIGNYNLPVMSNLIYLAVALAVSARAGFATDYAVAARPAETQGRAPEAPAPPAMRRATGIGLASRVGQAAYRVIQRHRAVVSLVAYGSIAALAYTLAFLLRFEFVWPERYAATFLASLPLLVVLRLACARAFRLGTGRWRFVGTRDVVNLASAASAGTIVFYIATQAIPFSPAVPRSVVLIECVLNVCLTAALWIAYRITFEELRHRRSGLNGRAKRVLVIGAGEAGNMLVHEMLRFPTGYKPVGFIDDDGAKVGTSLHGVDVLGTTERLRTIATTMRADEIIVAIPSASAADLRRIVQRCEATELPFKALPGIAEVVAGDIRLSQLRDVRIEDLLGREPITLELPELAADLHQRTVLITGAAGSIGSELSRQVALHQPARLVVLDQAETDLFYLEMDLREKHPELAVVPVIGDVADAGAIERVFREHRPDWVFHAAAYKHVPIMEANAREAVRNNVIGTWRVAEAAGRHGIAKFVLVSTDKAVRPVSVMGATKRLAEMVVLDLQDRYAGTTYAAVRFGNVLGSNGSVIPIFKRQLEAGKPLTVTDPDATRYFMTIPEAVQLILQAALLPEIRGRIAMLDMGDPVRIVDLATNMLRLAGRVDRKLHQLRFTGLRPGEKLHEDLVGPEETTVPTAMPKVRLIASRQATAGDFETYLARLVRIVHDESDVHVLAAVRTLFPGIRGNQASPAVATSAGIALQSPFETQARLPAARL